MISYPHKCIFIHVPKTGGSSIEKVLWPEKTDRTEENLWMGFVDSYHNKYQTGGLQHLTSSQIRTEVGEEVHQRFFKFSVVRNPWDKAISQYLYMQKRKDLRDFLGMAKTTSFKAYLDLIQSKNHVQWAPQIGFLADEKGSLIVDYLIRFENLEAGFLTILERLGFEACQLPHLNSSFREHYSTYYDEESREMIAEFYKADIQAFSYQFTENVPLG